MTKKKINITLNSSASKEPKEAILVQVYGGIFSKALKNIKKNI